MKRPIPPSNFRTADRLTLEDFAVMRRYFEQLTTWVESEIAEAATISEIAEGTGVVVTDGTGPTVTVAADIGTGAGQVAAGDNVLLRSASDWSGFATKATPTVADYLLIEDAAAGGAKKRAAWPTTSAGGTGNPFIDPPTTPWSVWDDEFNSGSPDLATRGWTVYSSGGACTRVGDISGPGAGGLSSTQYRSTLVGSVLLIQTGAKSLALDKIATMGTALATTGTMCARMGMQSRNTNLSTLRRMIATSGTTNVNYTNGNKHTYHEHRMSGGTNVIRYTADLAGSGAYWTTTQNVDWSFQDDILWMSKNGSGTSSACTVSSGSMGPRFSDFQGNGSVGAWNSVGLNIGSTGAATIDGWWGGIIALDYVRFSTTHERWFT